MQGSSTSFDGPSVFSISSLNLTIKERNEGRRRGGRGGLVGRELGWGTLTVWLWRGAVSGFRQKGSRPSISCRVVFVRARSCKKEKRKKPSQLYYPSFCPERSQASKQASKTFLLESIDRSTSTKGSSSPCLPFFLFSSIPPPSPLLGFHLYIEIVYGTERTGHRLFYSGVYRDWPRRNLFRRAELREIQSTNWIGFPLDWGRATVERILNKLAKLTDGRRGPD